MIDLKGALQTLNTEKQQDFILFLNRKNKRKDTKNIQYIKLLLTKDWSSKDICITLYGSEHKVAFHALRKRLFTSLIDFTANMSMNEENSVDVSLIKHIVSARYFLQNGQFKTGYRVLDKAKMIAEKYQLFTILSEIYHTKIEYAHTNQKTHLPDLIARFKENQKQLAIEENLNIAYAKIRQRLSEEHINKENTDIKILIEQILSEENINFSEVVSYKSLYQIIQITAISSSQKFDYWNIEDFIMTTYSTIKNHKAKDKQLYHHIEILYVISNILFRNKKFDTSLEYLKEMIFCMNENNKKYFKEFISRHDLLLAFNENYKGNQQNAIEILKRYKDNKSLNIITQLDIGLALIVFYSQQGLLNEARKLFAKFYHTDKWYVEKAGIIWTIKKNLIEILLQIDLGNIEIVDSRLLSFKRNYFKYLKDIKQEKVITYLKLVEIYYKNPEIIKTQEFHYKVEKSFYWLENSKEDVFMMSFFAWLKAKMNQKNLYSTTLKLVHNQ